eukprot:764095-Hanusia_phi.AAC.1
MGNTGVVMALAESATGGAETAGEDRRWGDEGRELYHSSRMLLARSKVAGGETQTDMRGEPTLSPPCPLLQLGGGGGGERAGRGGGGD